MSIDYKRTEKSKEIKTTKAKLLYILSWTEQEHMLSGDGLNGFNQPTQIYGTFCIELLYKNPLLLISIWVQELYVYGIILYHNIYMWELITLEHPLEMMSMQLVLMTYTILLLINGSLFIKVIVLMLKSKYSLLNGPILKNKMLLLTLISMFLDNSQFF